MELFHVSSQILHSGTVVGPYTRTLFTASRLGECQYAALERVFANARPTTGASRESAIFAFDSLEACRNFWDGERDGGARRAAYAVEPHYYRITMPTPTQAPIALVDHAYKRLQVGLPYDEIVTEYWSPRPRWRAWEFLADTATVVEEVPAPTDVPALGISISEHWEDVRLMRQLWPLT